MKAIIWPAYGAPEVLKTVDIPTPTVNKNQVRVKIHASTAFPADCEMRRFEMPTKALWLPIRLYFGLFKPRGTKILGQEFAGVIDKIGSEVTKFSVGDEVFGCTGIEFGTYAQYIVRDESSALALKPANKTFAQIVPFATGGSNAQYYLDKANIKANDRILIYGAAGCIGSFAVQMAKQAKAQVVAVDSADKLDFLTSLGADQVLDYKTQDPLTLATGSFDLIFDVVGKLPYPQCLEHLTPNGQYATANPKPGQQRKAQGKSVDCSLAEPTAETLQQLATLAQNDTIHACIDKTFDLDNAVEAHKFVESGLKQGHVVLAVIPDE